MSIFRRAAEKKGTPADALVLGLGNPGREYEGSRHNVGAEVVDLLADRAGRSLSVARKELSLLCEFVAPPDHKVVAAFPQTYMNESGRAASFLVHRYGIDDPTRIIVVHDELDLPVGVVKVKAGGGLAGHNGLKSIAQHVGSRDFLRVRIGVGKPPNPQAGANWVLKPPSKQDRTELDVAVVEAHDAVLDVVANGVETAMNHWNAPR